MPLQLLFHLELLQFQRDLDWNVLALSFLLQRDFENSLAVWKLLPFAGPLFSAKAQ